MIKAILCVIGALISTLERAAECEQRRAERALTKASALVSKANGHRASAKFARKVAGGLTDIKE